MIGLRRDPKGQTIFERTGSTAEAGRIGTAKSEDTQTTILSLTVKIKEMETELSNYKVRSNTVVYCSNLPLQ